MTKPILLILHGALGSKKQLEPISKKLSNNFDVHSFNFEGHGGIQLPDKYSINLFTTNLERYLSENTLDDVFIFGYSMGGYVALNLARKDNRIKQIFTLGTKFHWTPDSANHEVKMLNPDKIEEKVPVFAKALADRHAPEDWKKVMSMTADMMLELGNNPVLTKATLTDIKIPVTITWGDQDNMVTKEESEKAASNISNAEFITFSGFKHPIEQVDLNELSSTITKTFLK